MIVHPDGDAGRAIQLYDPTTGVLRVLDSSSAFYTGLAWRKDSDDLAVLRSKVSSDFEEETQIVLAWKGLAAVKPEAKSLDPTSSPGFPAETRIVSYQAPTWASTGRDDLSLAPKPGPGSPRTKKRTKKRTGIRTKTRIRTKT